MLAASLSYPIMATGAHFYVALPRCKSSPSIVTGRGSICRARPPSQRPLGGSGSPSAPDTCRLRLCAMIAGGACATPDRGNNARLCEPFALCVRSGLGRRLRPVEGIKEEARVQQPSRWPWAMESLIGCTYSVARHRLGNTMCTAPPRRTRPGSSSQCAQVRAAGSRKRSKRASRKQPKLYSSRPCCASTDSERMQTRASERFASRK